MSFKQFLCLLLVSVIMLSLAGCTEERYDEPTVRDDGGEDLLGDWCFEVTLTEQITDTGKVIPEPVSVCFSFREDGTLLLYMDEDTKEQTAQEFERQILENLDAWIYGEWAPAGYTPEEVDALFAEAYGMSVDKYKRDTLADANIRSTLDALADEYQYHADDKVLTIDGIPMLYTIDGDTLTITDCTDPNFWVSVGLEIPVVMTKKD